MARKVVLMLLGCALLATVVSAAMLVVSLAGTPGKPAGAPAEAVGQATTPSQRGRAVVALPQLIDAGADPADANDAAALLTARFKPATPGRTVSVEGRTGPTGDWQVVARGVQDGNGWVRVEVPQAGDWRQFRAVAVATGDLNEVRSRPVVSRWLPGVLAEFDAESPDWTTAEVADGTASIPAGGRLSSVVPALDGDGILATRIQVAERGQSGLVVSQGDGSQLALVNRGGALVAQARDGQRVRALSGPSDSGPLRPEYAEWSAGFHVIAIQRTGPDAIFLVDGQPFAQANGVVVEGPWTLAAESAKSPATVDWVRSWSHQG